MRLAVVLVLAATALAQEFDNRDRRQTYGGIQFGGSRNPTQQSHDGGRSPSPSFLSQSGFRPIQSVPSFGPAYPAPSPQGFRPAPVEENEREGNDVGPIRFSSPIPVTRSKPTPSPIILVSTPRVQQRPVSVTPTPQPLRAVQATPQPVRQRPFPTAPVSYRQPAEDNDRDYQHSGLIQVPVSRPYTQQRPQPQQSGRRPQQQQRPQFSQQRPLQEEPLEEEEEEKEEPDRLSLLLPQTKFDCAGKNGYYADEELSCEVFHYCQDNARHSWICPNGFTFHQVHLICMPPGNDNICAKSSQFHFVNEYLYRPINAEEAETRPNVTLKYADRYYPDSYQGDQEQQHYVAVPQPQRVAATPAPQRGRPILVSNVRPQQFGGAPSFRPQPNQVFHSPEEVNIPLQHRRPSQSSQPARGSSVYQQSAPQYSREDDEYDYDDNNNYNNNFRQG